MMTEEEVIYIDGLIERLKLFKDDDNGTIRWSIDRLIGLQFQITSRRTRFPQKRFGIITKIYDRILGKIAGFFFNLARKRRNK